MLTAPLRRFGETTKWTDATTNARMAKNT